MAEYPERHTFKGKGKRKIGHTNAKVTASIIMIVTIIIIMIKIFIQEHAITHGWFSDENCY